MRTTLLPLALALIGALPQFARAADPVGTTEAMRLLKSNCFSCHNEQKKKGGLVMNSREALLKGGDNGAALVVGVPEKSVLIESLAADADPHMPPKKQLSVPQIAALKRWVQQGAPWDATALVDQPSTPRAVSLVSLPAWDPLESTCRHASLSIL